MLVGTKRQDKRKFRIKWRKTWGKNMRLHFSELHFHRWNSMAHIHLSMMALPTSTTLCPVHLSAMQRHSATYLWSCKVESHFVRCWVQVIPPHHVRHCVIVYLRWNEWWHKKIFCTRFIFYSTFLKMPIFEKVDEKNRFLVLSFCAISADTDHMSTPYTSSFDYISVKLRKFRSVER